MLNEDGLSRDEFDAAVLSLNGQFIDVLEKNEASSALAFCAVALILQYIWTRTETPYRGDYKRKVKKDCKSLEAFAMAAYDCGVVTAHRSFGDVAGHA